MISGIVPLERSEITVTHVDDFYVSDYARGSSSVTSVRAYDSMTDEMYEVYKKHGGMKKHPLDEVQGL